jgi:hypothetical protein
MSDESKGLPGWDAITNALRGLYGDVEPLHWGTILPSYLGGPDPLDGMSAYKVLEPVPHWHIIGMGLSELADKRSDDPAVSGFGYEFTFRLACEAGEERPPNWALNFMQNLARAVTVHGVRFGAYHTIDANGPIAVGDPTRLTAAVFVPDPRLGTIETPNGRVEFLQIVGITHDELEAMRDWSSRGVLDVMAGRNPLWVTELRRGSLLDDPAAAAAVAEGAAREGARPGALDVSELRWKKLLLRNTVEVAIGALVVPEVVKMIRTRTLRGQPFLLSNDRDGIGMSVAPGERSGWEMKGRVLELVLTPALAEEVARTLKPVRGVYAWDELGGLRVKVEPSEIVDGEGRVTKTLG